GLKGSLDNREKTECLHCRILIMELKTPWPAGANSLALAALAKPRTCEIRARFGDIDARPRNRLGGMSSPHLGRGSRPSRAGSPDQAAMIIAWRPRARSRSALGPIA